MLYIFSYYIKVSQKLCNNLVTYGTIQLLWMILLNQEGDELHLIVRCWARLILSECYSLDLLAHLAGTAEYTDCISAEG